MQPNHSVLTYYGESGNVKVGQETPNAEVRGAKHAFVALLCHLKLDKAPFCKLTGL